MKFFRAASAIIFILNRICLNENDDDFCVLLMFFSTTTTTVVVAAAAAATTKMFHVLSLSLSFNDIAHSFSLPHFCRTLFILSFFTYTH